MKKFLLSIMTVLFFVGGLSAQERVALGYCEDKLGGTIIAQDPLPHEFGAAIYLPAEILNKYVGSTINTIDFAIGGVAGDVMTVFIARELEGKPLLSKQTADFKKGWNTVKFNKGYTIKEGDKLYIGYRYYTTEECLGAEVMIFDYHQGSIPGTNWFSQDNKWWKFDTSSINFDLAIRAFAEGTNLPKTDIGARDLVSPATIIKNQPNDYTFNMRNYGTENVSNIKFNVLANGEIYDTKELTGLDFPNNMEMNVKLEGITFPNEGNNTLGIDIIEVNGSTDTDKNDNVIETPVYSINENAKPVHRNVLFEEFTTEKDKSSIDADSVYNLAVSEYDNVKWVKHHLSDQFFLDKEAGYNFLFENNQTFYPAISVDRNTFDGLQERGPAYFVGHENIVADLFKISSGIVSYILPEATAHFDETSRQLKVNIDIKPEVIEMPLQTDLRLTVYVVEDGVVSTTQKGRNEFVQNGVIRDIITEGWGDKIDISNGDISKEYTCNIPSEWNEKNMRVIAFVNNYDKKDALNCMVYNTCEALFDTNAGINDIEGDVVDAMVWYENGRLNVTNGYSIVAIYDISGAMVSNVSHGMYLVKVVAANGKCLVKKVMIK